MLNKDFETHDGSYIEDFDNYKEANETMIEEKRKKSFKLFDAFMQLLHPLRDQL